MDNELITRESKMLASLLSRNERLIVDLKTLAEKIIPLLHGGRFLTDKELSERLKITRRTLQEYRNGGRLPFLILGGKVLYRESDVQRMLDDNYHPGLR